MSNQVSMMSRSLVRLGVCATAAAVCVVGTPAAVSAWADPALAAPDSTVTVVVTSADPVSADGWYDQPVAVAVSAPAGVTVQSRANAGAWRTGSRTVTVSADGTSTVDYRLLRAGVVVPGSSGQTVVKVDRSLPTVAVSRTPSSQGTPRNPVQIAMTGSDIVSGVDRVEYRIDSGGWASAPAAGVTLDQVGQYVIMARSVDKAGNVSTSRSTTAVITPDPDTTGTVWPRSGRVGTPVTFVVRGFQRFDDVTLASDGTTWGTVRTDVNGLAKITVTVPAGISPWASEVTAIGSDPATFVIIPFAVQ